MAAPPILLVADDLAIIAAVKRVLGREGYECILATSAADAVIAFGHALPGLVLLQPSVESDRGSVVLEELQNHPDTQLLRVVLLGETVPGFAWPVEPLPIDPEHFGTTLEDNVRSATPGGNWAVVETAPKAEVPRVAPVVEADPWRATAPREVDPAEAAGEEVPEPRALFDDPAPTPPPSVTEALEEKLFGDLARDVEAEAMQSVENTLAQQQAEAADQELQQLEHEVRAEARRRRDARQTGEAVKPAPPSPPGPTTELMSDEPVSQETAFEDLGDTPAAPPSQAAEVLTRAEQLLLETRAQSEARRGVEANELKQLRDELSTATERATEAEAQLTQAQQRADQLDATLAQLRTEANATAERSAQHEAELESLRAATEARATEAEAQRATDEAELVNAREELSRLTALLEANQSASRTESNTHEHDLGELRAELELEQEARAALVTEHEALRQRLADVELEARSNTEQRDTRVSELSAELEIARNQAADAERRAGRLDDALRAAREDADAALALASEVEAERQLLAEVRSQLDLANQRNEELRFARDTAQGEMLAHEEAVERLTTQLQDTQAQLERARVDASSSSELLEETARARDQLRHRVGQLEREQELAAQLELEREAERTASVQHLQDVQRQAREQLQEAQAAAEARLEQQAQLHEQALAEERARAENAREAMEATQAAHAEQLERERQSVEATIAALREQLAESERSAARALEGERTRAQQEQSALEAQLQETSAAGQALQSKLEAANATIEELRGQLDTQRSEAKQLEATVQVTSEKVKALEAREVMPLTLPNQRQLGVARHGTVDLAGLARVVGQLVLGNAEVRLELGAGTGSRSLWFKRGQIVAAESTFDTESLVARARRDGLIDGRQEGELRMLKGATPREQLDALKARAFIRDVEAVPLVQRYTEQVALDAFTEPETLYRIVEEPPAAEVLPATVPRPTLPMLAESLRRAVPPDLLLEQLGGGEAVAFSTDSELDLRALGFSERERKMLSWVDGEATIEDLSLASGLKPDHSFRALLVAKLLGLIEVKPGEKKVEASNGQLDVHRLEAKYDEVQDADYFTILGLSRAAGTDDVRRAFERLSQEFDPLRFSGHPDPSLQQRAQVVARLLEEAARALEDDRRRTEYARHLMD